MCQHCEDLFVVIIAQVNLFYAVTRLRNLSELQNLSVFHGSKVTNKINDHLSICAQEMDYFKK